MKLSSAIGGGFAGAIVLTLLHESLRRLNPEAPRMDKLGMKAISKSLEAINMNVPGDDNLFKITMAGDIITNTLYYSLAAFHHEKKAILRGAFLGLAAGFGAVYLPKPMGLNNSSSNHTIETKLLTVGLYLTGGLVAGLTTRLIENSQSK